MADQKITQLTDDASPSGDDLIVTVNDPGGTPANKKVTITNLAAFLAALTQTLTNKTLTSPSFSGNISGWIADSNTWTYSSVDGATGIVTINADLTGVIQAGDRILITQTTSKYFIVTKTPTYGSSVTTITMWGGTDYTLANADITNPYYSHQKSPFGFNTDPSKWSVTTTDTSNNSQSSPVNNTWYNLGSLNIVIPIGAWDVSYKVYAVIEKSASALLPVFTTLSTANNSDTDADFLARTYGTGTAVGGTHFTQKHLVLSSKTTYYLNTKTDVSSIDTLFNAGGQVSTKIRAVCGYL